MSAAADAEARRIARTIIAAALRAVDPARLVAAALTERITWRPPAAQLRVIALGKAALGMARGASAMLGDRPRSGLAVCPEEVPTEGPPGFRVIRAGHPLPNAASVEAARRVARSIRAAKADEEVLVLLSGGTSALVALPASGLTLADLRSTTTLLQKAGASVEELNAVRKHLDDVKGGGLARASSARITGLVLSDVAGDRLDVIGSGPFSPDPSTFDDALGVLERFDLVAGVPAAVRRRLELGAAGGLPETLKAGEALASEVEMLVVGGLRQALDAAAEAAAAEGFIVERLAGEVEGEARQAGRALAGWLRRSAARLRSGERVCLVAGGEATVGVRGDGRGGRNQETALAAAFELDGAENVLLTCCATDGVDGTSTAAGAWVDGASLTRARRRGIDPRRALERNDSHSFFVAIGDQVVTGPTGTNVRDLVVGLAW